MMDETQIQFTLKVKRLLHQLQWERKKIHTREKDDFIARISKMSKELISDIKAFKPMGVEYQNWKAYKDLCRYVESHPKHSPIIIDFEDLRESIPTNEKEKIDYRMKTKFEKEIFEFFEKLNIQIDDNGKFDYDYILSNLFILKENFQNEVIENCTALPEKDRDFYLARLINRIEKVPDSVICEDEEEDKLYKLGLKTEYGIIEPEQLEFYFKKVSEYKHKIIEFLKGIYPEKNKSKQAAPVKTFESLFRDPDKANEVKKIFDTRGYTSNGNWIGLSGKKTELLAAYYVLVPLLKGKKHTPRATTFYNEFGLSVGIDNIKNGGDITDKSLRIEPHNEDREEFQKIFAHILPKK